MNIQTLIEEFAARLQKHVDGHAMERARTTVMGALGIAPRRGPGRPPKALALVSASAPIKARRKGPIQLCPVPGCKNKAAPVFGMVCSEHKDVAKSKIKKYREARKAKKEGVRSVAKQTTKAPIAKRTPKQRAKPAKDTSKRRVRKAAVTKAGPGVAPTALA